MRLDVAELKAAVDAVREACAKDDAGKMAPMVLEWSASRLVVRARSQMVSLSAECACEEKSSGCCAVDGHQLASIIHALTGKSVELVHDEAKETMRLVSGAFKMTITTANTLDIPKPHRTDDSAPMADVNARNLATLVRSVAYAQSTDITRAAINGVRLSWSDGDMVTAAATDGHRLAVRSMKVSEMWRIGGSPIVIHRHGVRALLRMLDRVGDGVVRVSIQHGSMVCSVGGVVLHAALNPLAFPDVDRVVPKNLGRMVRVDDAGQFSDAIKRVSDIQRASNTDGCHLELRADAVGLRCIDANQGEACEEFPALVAGTGVRVRANGQYLIDALAQMSDDESVTDMHVGEPTDPIMFTNSHGHAVVMPMRI